ncbi:E3 ubiquitin-protein ligase DZIP3-like [Orbicella faveolata]|uniref:E3 ubiquitin-protein ligase DZIP3-like n=1 Tax=Orbicella faveolata TaxID=48498 RepID=UPI0009E5AABD|nr:E3 ubiquitin-protein ligase DZIP3-like [Orbicella faveolata]XP_020616768.1 E3 ubiquitin-protein ligase DZIP3-like [Orbicella faveolata]
MAAAPDPDEILRSTKGKGNFQRVARLLISGGTTLLREIFDQLSPPSSLPTILKRPATQKQLKAAKLTKPQWDCLYPSPGVYGKSADFDVTLLFRLLRTICNLTPLTTGWDALPTSTDNSLVADLVRIKYYRNSVYGHVSQNMEITDDEFPQLWEDISEALLRIAGQISPTKKTAWQEAIGNFLKDPLTAEDERNVQELRRWYKNDVEVKEFIESSAQKTRKRMKRLKRSVREEAQ